MAGTIRHSKLLKDWRTVGDETENWEMTVQFSILELTLVLKSAIT
jgi:hypothetical protein